MRTWECHLNWYSGVILATKNCTCIKRQEAGLQRCWSLVGNYKIDSQWPRKDSFQWPHKVLSFIFFFFSLLISEWPLALGSMGRVQPATPTPLRMLPCKATDLNRSFVRFSNKFNKINTSFSERRYCPKTWVQFL